MNRQPTTSESQMRERIDRLVSGELGDEERRELLAWLEADVSRWRGCALAFLEAQVWEEALGESVQGSRHRGQQSGNRELETGNTGQESCSRGQRSAVAWLMPLLAVAASMAAFACGMWWRGMNMPPQQPGGSIVEHKQVTTKQDDQILPQIDGPLLASVPVKGGPLGNVPAVLQFPVLPPEVAQGQSSSVPEHVRREWERRGYEVKEEQRYLPARLPDGRQVMVPVNEVKMKYVGRPVS